MKDKEKIRLAIGSYVYDITYMWTPFFLILVTVAVPLLFGVWGQGWDPLMWRTFGIHHTVILFAIGIASAVLILGEKMDRVLVLGGLVFMVAIHEMPWWVCAEMKWGDLSTFLGLFGAYFFPMCLIVLIFYIGITGLPWKLILANVLLYAVWYAAGFPLTQIWNTPLTPTGKTSLYYEPWANGVEIGSWIYEIFAFVLLEVPRLKTLQGAGLIKFKQMVKMNQLK